MTKKISQTKTFFTQAQLAVLESKGIKLTESTRFANVYYKPGRYGISIFAGKCGALQVDWESLDDFIEELREFQEVYGT